MKHARSLAARTAGPAVTLLGLISATTAHAQFLFATDFDSGVSGFPLYTTGTYGYKFQVGNVPLKVTGLAAAYDVVGNVRLYQDGTSTDIANVALTDTHFAISPYANTYVYEMLTTPVTLSANTTYDIVWDNPDYGQAFSFATPGISLNSDLTLGSSISDFSTRSYPTTDAFGAGSYFGPAPLVATPEPSTLAILGVGGIVSLSFARRNRKLRTK